MKKILLLCAACVLHFSLCAQEPRGFLNRTPEFPQVNTPVAASFHKFVDQPVSPYTGTPEITVPLITLEDGMIRLPIALRYNSSGIKVSEEAGWVGLGWNLQVGGVITQQTVGDFDQIDTEYKNLLSRMELTTDRIYNWSTYPYTQTIHNAFPSGMHNVSYRAGKMNPDVFYYSYPGGSGKFIIDYRTDQIHILNREENIKIEITGTSSTQAASIQEFRITTTEGIKHYFTQYTQMSHLNVPLNLVSVSYVLTSSVYPNGQTVAYQYQKTKHSSYQKNFSFQAPYASSGTSRFLGDWYSTSSTSTYEGSEFYLSRLITSNYNITFELGTRSDLQDGRRLNTMKITSLSTAGTPFEKEFRFQYSYYTASNTGAKWRPPVGGYNQEYATKRLRLDAVYQQAGTTISDKYEFTYNTTDIADKYSYQTDHWGYYNGKGTHETYLPNIRTMKWGHILNNGNYEELSNLFEKYHYTSHNDRSATSGFCQAGILTGIRYPTGGYTQFTYELNSFMDLKENQNLSKNTISVEDWNNSFYKSYQQFQLDKDAQAEIEFTLSRGLTPWVDLWKHGSVFCQLLRDGSAVVRKDFADDCLYQANHNPTNGYLSYKTTLNLLSHNSNGQQYTYTLVAQIPSALGNQYGASTNHTSMKAILTYSTGKSSITRAEQQGCGVRIRKIDFYQQKGDATPFKSVSYEYKDPATGESSGILQEQIQFIKPYSGTFSYLRDLAVTGTNYVLARLNVAEITGSNIISNPYSTVGGVGYSYVKEIHTGNGLHAGYTEYRYHNKRPTFTLTSVRLDDPANGKPISITHCDSQGKVKSSESYTYQIKDVHHYFGVNVRDNFNMFPGIYSREPLVRPESYENDKGYYPGRMTILLHQLNAYDVTLQNKTIRTDGVSVKEEYGYDASTLQLTQRQHSATGSDVLTYRYSYPNHYNFAPYTRLTQENRIHRPVEEKVLRNGNLIEATLTEYQVFGNSNLVLPARTYVSQITGQTGNPTTYTSGGPLASVYPYWSSSFERYDLRGNPQEIRTTDGPGTVYLWGYNYQYPVAKIEGATYEQVKAALTENYINSLATNQAITAATAAEIRNKLTSLPALVTTYVYKPHTGLLSTILPNGDTFTYQYDPFGRLLKITDTHGKTIEEYQYHYKP